MCTDITSSAKRGTGCPNHNMCASNFATVAVLKECAVASFGLGVLDVAKDADGKVGEIKGEIRGNHSANAKDSSPKDLSPPPSPPNSPPSHNRPPTRDNRCPPPRDVSIHGRGGYGSFKDTRRWRDPLVRGRGGYGGMDLRPPEEIALQAERQKAIYLEAARHAEQLKLRTDELACEKEARRQNYERRLLEESRRRDHASQLDAERLQASVHSRIVPASTRKPPPPPPFPPLVEPTVPSLLFGWNSRLRRL